MKNVVDLKSLAVLTSVFILFTAVGTISHELGHVITAHSLGYQTTLHYNSVSYQGSDLENRMREIYNEFQTEIIQGKDFQLKSEYERGVEMLERNILLVTLGGPVQTVLTGTAGFLFVLFRRRKIMEYGLYLTDWLGVFLSLFWLREVFNPVMSVAMEILHPDGRYFGGDERIISTALNLWEGTFPVILAAFGLFISLFVIFKIIPKNLRLTFILSGLLGAGIGFIFWMDFAGPMLLP